MTIQTYRENSNWLKLGTGPNILYNTFHFPKHSTCHQNQETICVCWTNSLLSHKSNLCLYKELVSYVISRVFVEISTGSFQWVRRHSQACGDYLKKFDNLEFYYRTVTLLIVSHQETETDLYFTKLLKLLQVLVHITEKICVINRLRNLENLYYGDFHNS